MDPLVQNRIRVINNAIAILSCTVTDIGCHLFGGQLPNGVSADPDSEARLQILYSTLRELKSARDAIRPLLEIIENKVELFQKECNPLTLKLRFSNLPDDILQRIFEVGSTLDKYGGRFSVLVSHVCRRFRDVAFRTPRIWAVIHDSQPLDQISTFLRGSKAVDICVLVGYRGPRRRTDIEPFMNIVTQHSDRWFAFGCHVGDGEDEDMQRSLACLELILPNLTILAHSQELFEEPPGLGLFSSWVMPRLSEFHGSDITLQPSMLGENVTSCELDFDGSKDDDDYRTWNFTHVLHALKTACALSELTLYFDDLRNENIVSEMPVTAIPSVETLHISFLRCNTSKLIQPLMLALRTPNLSHLLVELALPTDHPEDPNVLLESVLPGEKPYPKISSFDLTVIDSDLIHPTLPVFPAKKLPSLVNLSLTGVAFYFYGTHKDYPVSWTNIRLNLCDQLSDCHIDNIINSVQHSDKRGDFQTLKISNCRGIYLPYLKELKAGVGDKLEYQLAYNYERKWQLFLALPTT